MFITSRNLKKTRGECAKLFRYLRTGAQINFFTSVRVQLSMKFFSLLDSTKVLDINLNLMGMEVGIFPAGQDLPGNSLLWKRRQLQHL